MMINLDIQFTSVKIKLIWYVCYTVIYLYGGSHHQNV